MVLRKKDEVNQIQTFIVEKEQKVEELTQLGDTVFSAKADC